MFDEYTYLTRLEAADVPEFAQLLLQTAKNSSEAVQAGALLRCYFGNALYDRLYGLALRWEISQRDRAKSPQGNVVIIPGLLGSQLTSTDDTGQQEPLWLNLPNIAAGKLARLRLKADGRSAVDARYTVRATGILKRCYGELLLSLATQWHVHAFWYDWRKEFELAAAELQASIKRWYGEDEPVHLIAHASGGLVARWYLAQNHHRWLKAHKGQRSKLIMLGTPNHGSLAAPLAVAGLPTLFQWVDHLDADYQGHDYRAMVSSFPSLYQLFPAHALLADKEFADQLYDPATYGPDGIIPPGQLEKAKHSQAALASYKTAATPLQMLLVAGYNQPTIVGLSNLAQFRQVTRAGLNNPAATRAMLAGDDDLLKIGPDGDGFVPLELAELPGIATLYVEEGHGRLQANRILLEALPSLIHYDATAADRATRNLAALAASAGLHTQRPGLEHFAARFLKADEDKSSRLRDPQIVQEQIDQQTRSAWISQKERQARAARGPLQRLLTRDGRLQRPERVVEELQIMADLMTRTILSVEEAETGLRPSIAPFDPPKITLAIIQGDVFELDSQPTINDKLPVDALAIGHYQEPLTAGVIGQLDRAISQAVFDKEAVTEGTVARSAQASPTDLLLTQYLERGIIRSALGQLFFLPDLRQGDQAAGRLLAIVGMGPPGQFGEAELVVAVRDLCWSLGRMGKRHLVTVLLGTDQDNLPIYQAAAGWVRGIKYAITGEEGRSLEQITFVIRDPVKAKDFTQALQREATQLRDKQRMFIHPEQLQIQHWASQQPTSERAGERPPQPFSILPAARIFAQRTGDRFRFGAMTDSASIPERETRLDATLVAEANRQLIGLSRLGNQLDQGRYLEQLVVPDDLRKQLRAIGPLVMILDATTARVHWEMLADSVGVSDDDDGALERFWGIGRGLTRQLRTPFAPSPEYPPPQKRILRALVVADPAADAPLPWAAEEGVLVADLLERFNVAHAHTPNRIEVVRLIGPQQATRANVLKHLLNHSYDLLHFAGHSQYDAEMPERSGWIFSNNERLTAFEIARVDRVPTFIFSNSCDSGVTPERPELFDPALAPTFAETFFKQGVADFVCTAWPVNDLAGRDFALTLYAALLDLRSSTGNLSDIDSYGPGGGLMPLYQALRDARRAIAQEPYDLRTWGAYQHYGNPYFRFFALESMSQPPPAAQVESRPIAEDQTHPPPLEMPRIAPFEPLIQRGKLDHRAAVKIGIPPQRRLVETASFLKLDKARTEFGVSGKGLVVAVLDGGLNLQHKDFAGGERVLACKNFTTEGAEDKVPDVTSGHGTHVTGIIAANGIHVGIAPEAKIVALKIATNEQQDNFDFGPVAAALHWVQEHAAAFNISAVSLSVADIQNYQDLAAHDLLWQQLIAGAANPTLKKRRQRQQEQRALIVESIKALHERRIPVVVSAGNFYTFSNNGAPGMAFPAIVSEAVAVGAVYDDELPCGRRYAWLPRIPEAFSTRPGQITPFSQRLHQNVNPQAYTKVFAPGSLVTATGSRGREDSSTQEGTSQAAPVTTGVILLMQELYYAKQHQLPPVADLVRWLHQSGSPIHDSDDGYDNVNHTGLSYQALNAFAAFKQMEAEIDP